MGISITPNDDGSYTVECGTEELTFIPTGTRGGRTGGGNDRMIDTGGERHRPIDTGGQRHRAAIVVPLEVGPDPGFGRFLGVMPFEDASDLTRQIQDALQPLINSWGPESQLKLNVPAGTKVDIGKLLFSADKAAETHRLDHLDIMLTGDFFKK